MRMYFYVNRCSVLEDILKPFLESIQFGPSFCLLVLRLSRYQDRAYSSVRPMPHLCFRTFGFDSMRRAIILELHEAEGWREAHLIGQNDEYKKTENKILYSLSIAVLRPSCRIVRLEGALSLLCALDKRQKPCNLYNKSPRNM